MKFLPSLLIIVMAFAGIQTKALDNTNVKTARVTYIANSGFIVTIGTEKILFDGLFQNGMNKYLEPDQKTVSLIKNGLHPFDDIDLVFVSNFHADHFDPYIATQLMLHNKEVKMICPQQVINKMMIFTADYAQIKNRIIEATPVVNHYDRLMVNGCEIVACHVKHEKKENDHVENMGYLVNINGVKVFHSGDSNPETLDDIRGLQLADLDIDIAFLNDKYGVGRAAKATNEIVDARYNVLMHFEKYITDKTLHAFVERTKLHPRPHVFTIRNEYQDFYINDFIQKKVNEDLSLTLLQK
ncbi:MAG: MBL fold metallo-hydrolase [Prolixibacteraceae bacterium]|jgi:L-ascorbate metabolism protein UlaG (beta-lactamase superfamily)|nr:MBL fold metallo-hydrolase [Prolixibacteraceae bacterium]